MNKEYDITALLQNPQTQRKAFERVVNMYSEQLYWQIRRMVVSHDDANDLLQNTFVKAWSNLDYFRGEAHYFDKEQKKMSVRFRKKQDAPG